jgi:hypothetical protein
LSKKSLGYERLGRIVYRCGPSGWAGDLVRENFGRILVMRIKIAIGIIAVWWLLQVALIVVKGGYAG